jgi:hypothetical protein
VKIGANAFIVSRVRIKGLRHLFKGEARWKRAGKGKAVKRVEREEGIENQNGKNEGAKKEVEQKRGSRAETNGIEPA